MKIPLADFAGAACATPQGMQLFADDTGAAITRCREICASCPVQRTCRQWGVLHEQEGMWGGLLPEELRGQRRSRRIRLNKPTFSLQVELQAATKRTAA